MPASASVGDVEIALAAAAAGAARVRASFGGAVVAHSKGGGDFSTQVDVESEEAILAVILAARPDDGIVAEESGHRPGTGTRRWLVDPLCGTQNFAARTPLVAVNVALVDGDSTIVGVSADPVADELFWADDTGAYRRVGMTDSGLTPTSSSRLVDVNCDGPPDQAWVGPQLLVDRGLGARFSPRVLSTTLAVAWVAAGRRAGYVSDGQFVDNVHFAAGIAVCRAAGCVVTDLAGRPLERGRGLIVAADDETHAQLVALVRPHLAAAAG